MQINEINNEEITQVNLYLIINQNYYFINNNYYIITITQDKLKSFLVFIFASIHLSVIEYSNRIKVEVKHSNNVTPAVYLEMINRYKE